MFISNPFTVWILDTVTIVVSTAFYYYMFFGYKGDLDISNNCLSFYINYYKTFKSYDFLSALKKILFLLVYFKMVYNHLDLTFFILHKYGFLCFAIAFNISAIIIMVLYFEFLRKQREISATTIDYIIITIIIIIL